MIAHHPYIGLDFWGHNVRQPGWPPELTHCVDDPSTWGADKAQGATFVNPKVNQASSLVRVNEFLLQYSSPAAADQALRHAARQVMNCPPRGRSFHQNPQPDSPILDEPAPPVADHDESWVGVRATWATQDRHQWPSFYYVFRVARADNVLVVIESTGIPADRSAISMDLAVQKALPQYLRSRWLPAGTTRPWLHKERAHHNRIR